MKQVSDELVNKAERMAKTMRRNALEMAFQAGHNGAHLGPGFSMMELAAVLYGGILRIDPANPCSPDRDRFILSKGHGVLAYYTALEQAGFITHDELMTFEQNEGFLPGHPIMNLEKGIETSSGSLGMGLSLGVGVALAGRKAKRDYRVFVMLGDGECEEGSVWEAAMSAAQYKLDNLIVIVDRNKLQYDGTTSEVMDLGDLGAKWKSFGWEVAEIDGHNVREIFAAMEERPCSAGKPYVVIAHTVKGKGVSFMENKREWHHGRLSKSQYEAAMAEQNA